MQSRIYCRFNDLIRGWRIGDQVFSWSRLIFLRNSLQFGVNLLFASTTIPNTLSRIRHLWCKLWLTHESWPRIGHSSFIGDLQQTREYYERVSIRWSVVPIKLPTTRLTTKQKAEPCSAVHNHFQVAPPLWIIPLFVSELPKERVKQFKGLLNVLGSRISTGITPFSISHSQ